MKSMQGILVLFSIAFVASIDTGKINYPIDIACDNSFTLYVDERIIGSGNDPNITYHYEQTITPPKIIAFEAQNKFGQGGCVGKFDKTPTYSKDWK